MNGVRSERNGRDFRFHHLGVATSSFAAEIRAFAQVGYVPEDEEFADPAQGIRGQFLIGGGPRLEILADLPGRETLKPLLRRGIKLYHHAYEVQSIDAALANLRSASARVIRAPLPSVAFRGRNIAFVVLANRWVVEVIEASAAP